MGVFGKETKAIRKVDTENQNYGRAPRKIKFAHKFAGGETTLDLNSLTVPPEMSANGFSNPSTDMIGEAHIKLYRNNLTLTSSSKGKLIDFLSYNVTGPTTIQLIDFYDVLGNPGADAGEVIVGELELVPQRNNLFVAATPLVRTGTLLAGQTDITLPFPVTINDNSTEQCSSYIFFMDDKPQFRNVNNVTAAPAADGNYQEVPAVGGQTMLLRMNASVPYDRNYIVFSGGFAERPEGSITALVEAAMGAVNGMKSTVAALAGVAESTFGTTPSTVDLKTFGDTVTANGVRLTALETKVKFSATKNANQSLSTFADVVFNVVEIDNKNAYNSTTGVYTVPKTADYALETSGMINAGGNMNMYMQIMRNGAVLIQRYAYNPNAVDPLTVRKPVVTLNQGDTIKVQAAVDASATLLGTNANIVPLFSIVEV